jgi:hypothetical protein
LTGVWALTHLGSAGARKIKKRWLKTTHELISELKSALSQELKVKGISPDFKNQHRNITFSDGWVW